MAIQLVFCGTPEFAVPSLVALHESDKFEVCLVLSQPDRPSGRGQKLHPSPVKHKALELGLPVITPEKASADEVLTQLMSTHAQVGVVVAYGQILSQKFLDMFPEGCVNIHSSLLPRWRGAAPMQRAVMAGDPVTGVSLQKVVRKLDAGPVIGETKIDLTDEMGASELTSVLSLEGAKLLVSHLPLYVQHKLTLKEQDESLVTHAAKIDKAEAEINWSKPCREIHNIIRGLNMGGPFASTQFRGKNLKVHKSKVSQRQSVGVEAGTIVHVEGNSLHVACGSGALELLVVQPESKAKISISDFIRGYHPEIGEKFSG